MGSANFYEINRIQPPGPHELALLISQDLVKPFQRCLFITSQEGPSKKKPSSGLQ